MKTFKQIKFEEAMAMVANMQLENLYFVIEGKLACVENYSMDMAKLHEKEWFKREDSKEDNTEK